MTKTQKRRVVKGPKRTKSDITGIILPKEEIADLIEQHLNKDHPDHDLPFDVETFNSDSPLIRVNLDEQIMILAEVVEEQTEKHDQYLVCSFCAAIPPDLAVQVSESIKDSLPIKVYFEGMFFPYIDSESQVRTAWDVEALTRHHQSVYEAVLRENTEIISERKVLH